MTVKEIERYVRNLEIYYIRNQDSINARWKIEFGIEINRWKNFLKTLKKIKQ